MKKNNTPTILVDISNSRIAVLDALKAANYEESYNLATFQISKPKLASDDVVLRSKTALILGMAAAFGGESLLPRSLLRQYSEEAKPMTAEDYARKEAAEEKRQKRQAKRVKARNRTK